MPGAAVQQERRVSAMNMLLMGLLVCVFAMAVVAVAFRAATRPEGTLSSGQAEAKVEREAKPAPLFAPRVAVPAVPAAQQVPIELLLLQIENHVRLEQAAAESFIEFPTQALLHSKTASPFVN
jgi:hypothetical protein